MTTWEKMVKPIAAYASKNRGFATRLAERLAIRTGDMGRNWRQSVYEWLNKGTEPGYVDGCNVIAEATLLMNGSGSFSKKMGPKGPRNGVKNKLK